MKVVITGSSGYIGQALIKKLQTDGFKVTTLKRELLYGNFQALCDVIKNHDKIINLAGVNILQRWTKKHKKLIYSSRIDTTKNLVKAISFLNPEEQPEAFISISAIGIYKNDQKHDENSMEYSNEFIGKVVKDWETSSSELPETIRRIILRTGLVLGKNSGTIKKLLPFFKMGLGAKISNGKQPFPFVHIDDVTNAFLWAIKEKKIRGVFNLVAPNAISNKSFTKALAKSLNRPAFLIIPGILLKLIFGKAANLLISSPQPVPERLLESGFKFEYPEIETTLFSITGIK